MSLPSGTKLGPYEVLGPLGAGGMGEVYRARDTRLDRTIAIKILPAQFSSDPVHKQRFEREAKTISSLNHPHICTLHDVGHQDGVDYLVMECVEGETLAKRLEKGPLPLEQVLNCGAQIAGALDKAHRRGIVHRDLKPGNIMLTPAGAKLLDFGLAKPVATLTSAATLTAAVPSSPATEDGTFVGTFQYMSPEQVEGKELDGRSDIFSLGAVLYEMGTGKRAFQGKSQISVASAILEKDPEPISVLQPATPPALDRVIRTCLAKDPDERFQTAHDLKLQLRWIAEGSAATPTGAQPALGRPMTRRKRIVAASTALVMIAVLALLGLWLRRPLKQALIQAYIPAPDKTSFALADDDTAGPAVISPAGHYLAFVAQGEGRQQIWVRELSQNTSSPLPGTEGASYPFWSPDEESLGFFAEGKLKRVSVHAGAVLSLCDVQRARGGSWGTAGDIIFTPDTQDVLYAIAARGGAPRAVTHMESYHTTNRWPVFLPDGRRFLYLASNHQSAESSEHNGIYLGSLDGKEGRFVLPANSSFALASGYLLFLQNDTLFAQPFDSVRAQLIGSALPMGLPVYRNGGTWRGAFDASGSLLAYHPASGDQGPQLFWVDRSGKTLASFGVGHTFRGLSLSPDGRKLAVVETETPIAPIWIYDTERGTRSRFSFERNGDNSPVWSPDGSRIAFAERHSGPYDIYVKNANGSGSEELVFASPESKLVWDWTPDGRDLLIGMRRPAAMWLVPLSGEKRVQKLELGPTPIWGGAFSPDGRWLAYVSEETGRDEIYVTRFPSLEGKWQASNGGGRNVTWRRDGRALFYMTQDGLLNEVAVSIHGEEIEISAPKLLFKTNYANTDPLQGAPYVVTRDAQRFITMKPEQGFSTLNLMINWQESVRK